MRTGLMPGISRTGIHQVEVDPSEYQKERKREARRLRRTIDVIRARKYMHTGDRKYAGAYKRLRKRMTDKGIIRRYNKIKNSLNLVVVLREEENPAEFSPTTIIPKLISTTTQVAANKGGDSSDKG